MYDLYMQGCLRSGNGHGNKILQDQGKSREFYFESGKFYFYFCIFISVLNGF